MMWMTRAGGPEPQAEDAAVPVGARVWVLREAWAGRVVARSQGGLVYKVRREGRDVTLACLASDFLRLADGP